MVVAELEPQHEIAGVDDRAPAEHRGELCGGVDDREAHAGEQVDPVQVGVDVGSLPTLQLDETRHAVGVLTGEQCRRRRPHPARSLPPDVAGDPLVVAEHGRKVVAQGGVDRSCDGEGGHVTAIRGMP